MFVQFVQFWPYSVDTTVLADYKIRLLEYQLSSSVRPSSVRSAKIITMIERPNKKSLVNGLLIDCADIKIP
jgi:hypothetical protein